MTFQGRREMAREISEMIYGGILDGRLRAAFRRAPRIASFAIDERLIFTRQPIADGDGAFSPLSAQEMTHVDARRLLISTYCGAPSGELPPAPVIVPSWRRWAIINYRPPRPCTAIAGLAMMPACAYRIPLESSTKFSSPLAVPLW